jgi:hypothetical protein
MYRGPISIAISATSPIVGVIVIVHPRGQTTFLDEAGPNHPHRRGSDGGKGRKGKKN